MKLPEDEKLTVEQLLRVNEASKMYADALIVLGLARKVTMEQLIHLLVIVAGPKPVRTVMEALGGKLINEDDLKKKPNGES